MIEVALLPEAEGDLDSAAAFLEQQRTGLGVRFVASVDHTFHRIAENPNVGPEIAQDVRKLRVQRFPYNVIYRVQATRVLVVAVAHHRRRPEYWSDRL